MMVSIKSALLLILSSVRSVFIFAAAIHTKLPNTRFSTKVVAAWAFGATTRRCLDALLSYLNSFGRTGLTHSHKWVYLSNRQTLIYLQIFKK